MSQDNIRFKIHLSLKFTQYLRKLVGPDNLEEGEKKYGHCESKDSCSNKQWEDEGPESKVVADSLTFENKTGSQFLI
jgi:hypothetical protein